MKIAVFCTNWNEDVMRYYYSGLKRWAEETNNTVDIFTCYGRIGVDKPFNQGEYVIFNYPRFSSYDGIIYNATTIDDEEVRARLEDNIRRSEVPCVVLDHEVEGFSRIYIDQEYYLNQLTNHLIKDHNVKKFCYLGGNLENVEVAARFRGFTTALRDAGLELDPELVFERTFEWDDGYEVGQILLKDAQKFPQAIVCANDNMAAGVCDALIEAGLEVGRDCIVTGFDRYFLGENYAPSLTSVQRPREQLIYDACRMLEEYTAPVERKMQASLFFGQSCGCGVDHSNNNSGFRAKTLRTLDKIRVSRRSDYSMEEGVIGGFDVEPIIDAVRGQFSDQEEGGMNIHLFPDLATNLDREFKSLHHPTKVYEIFGNCDLRGRNSAGRAYVFTPIHYLDNVFGFCAFHSMPLLFENAELRNFTKTLGTSIEIMRQRARHMQINQELESLYETDSLTGTYNRHGLKKYSEQMLADAREAGKPLMISFVDIDGLKRVNDENGHEAGDIVIKLIGETVMDIVPDGVKVFRYGGDEFLVMGTDTDLEGKAGAVFAEMVEKRIKEKADEMHLPYHVGASVGFVIARPGEREPLDHYIKKADHAMYEVKLQHHQKLGTA